MCRAGKDTAAQTCFWFFFAPWERRTNRLRLRASARSSRVLGSAKCTLLRPAHGRTCKIPTCFLVAWTLHSTASDRALHSFCCRCDCASHLRAFVAVLGSWNIAPKTPRPGGAQHKAQSRCAKGTVRRSLPNISLSKSGRKND